MDLIRSLVSGKKKRLRCSGYDLDLSYITPRILAMSFPGEGLEKLYRNSADTVAKFLHERHGELFRVFNLSGMKFEYGKFGDVVEFPWLDHHSPPLDLLFKACDNIHEWLSQRSDSAVVVNCKAGKGRTGTLICCYLLFCGHFHDPDEALEYYRLQRFTEGGGVTQPSQKRYVHYFWRVLSGEIRWPLVKVFNKVILHTAPHMKNLTCRPFLVVLYEDREVYSTKEPTRDRNLKLKDSWDHPQDHYMLIRSRLQVKGDLLLKFYHWGRLSHKKICRVGINTAFIPRDDVYSLSKSELDPDSFAHSSKASEDFRMHLVFQSLCACSADLDLSARCATCREALGPLEIQRWESIHEVIRRLQAAGCNAALLLFGAERADDTLEELQRSRRQSSTLHTRTPTRDNSSS